ncbi:MAG: arylesterase [Gallionella sp.]|nr:arylesterase [Gallionella sp.]
MSKIVALPGMLLCVALWSFFAQAAPAAKNILVLGDSLSAGYGIAVEQSWPSLLQEELKHKRLKYNVVNASISGETTVGGRQRIGRLLEQYRPAIVIVELGANDGLRGFSTADIESNLNEILLQAGQVHARALLIGMKLPPNYGEPYITQFESMYPRLATRHTVALLPFLLEGVGADQFQPDNLHPLATTQPLIMHNVLEALKPLLR